MRTTIFAALGFLLFGVQPSARADEAGNGRRFGHVTQKRVLAESSKGENWLVNGGRFGGEHFSPLTQIDYGNVEKLGLAWSADVPSFTLAAEPIVVDGVAYLSGTLSQVFAIDRRFASI